MPPASSTQGKNILKIIFKNICFGARRSFLPQHTPLSLPGTVTNKGQWGRHESRIPEKWTRCTTLQLTQRRVCFTRSTSTAERLAWHTCVGKVSTEQRVVCLEKRPQPHATVHSQQQGRGERCTNVIQAPMRSSAALFIIFPIIIRITTNDNPGAHITSLHFHRHAQHAASLDTYTG